MKIQAPIPGLAGLVMAGGHSSRMGKDKALLRLGNGPSLLELSCSKIACLAPVWHVSCARGRSRPGYPCLEDSLENFGPLAGILKGLENALEHNCHALLVLACDLPLMTVSLLANLWELYIRTGHKLLAVYQNPESGVLEMQAALYNVQALPLFQKAAREGRRKLSAVIPVDDRLVLQYSTALEPCFLNCNSPSDLEKAEEFIRKKNTPDLPCSAGNKKGCL